MPKITKSLITNLPRVNRRTFIWEEATPGFGIVVQPTGSVSFVFQYRNENAQSRRMTLGGLADRTPDEARKAARDYAADVRKGGDPQQQKVAARKALTLNDVFDAYAASEAFKDKAPSTQETDLGRINNHLRPLLGRKVAEKVSGEAVRAAKRAIECGKTARESKTGWRAVSKVRGGDGAARQSMRLLKAVYAWAIAEKVLPLKSNPVDGVSLGSDGRRNIIMSGPEDYGRLFATLDQMETERRLQGRVADVIRLIALTGARRGEITGLRWREIDLERRLITKPPASHKTGRKTGEDRIIGLSSQAIEILQRQPKGAPGDLVFPPTRLDSAGREYPSSRKGAEGRLDVSTPWRAVRKEAQLPEGIGLHGLRHSLASHMAMQGAREAALMAQLGHKQTRTVQRYIHWAEKAHAQLAEDAASIVTATSGQDSDG